MKAITLKAGREKSALRYHPWIFSGAVDEIVGDPELGDTVEVYSYKSDFLGLAAYSPKSQIRGRFWTFGEKANIDREFFSDILDRAIAARKSRGFDIEDKGSAFRLINAENDGIPGCIIDTKSWLPAPKSTARTSTNCSPKRRTAAASTNAAIPKCAARKACNCARVSSMAKWAMSPSSSTRTESSSPST